MRFSHVSYAATLKNKEATYNISALAQRSLVLSSEISCVGYTQQKIPAIAGKKQTGHMRKRAIEKYLQSDAQK